MFANDKKKHYESATRKKNCSEEGKDVAGYQDIYIVLNENEIKRLLAM